MAILIFILIMVRNLFILSALLIPTIVSAHTKWFADENLTELYTSEPTGVYLSVWALIIFIISVAGIYMHKRNILRLDFVRPKGRKSYEKAASTFTMVAGAFFLIAGTHEYLFSPNLNLESGIPVSLIVLQIVVGLAFLVGIGTRVSAILLSLLWLMAIPYAGLIAVVENIWILSTAIFIAIMGNDYFSIISFSLLKKIFKPYKKYALSILRLGTGSTLMILGLSEKILAPEYGLNFLYLHDWNFMESLGLNFSDYLFTLSAGSFEFLLGLILVIGVMTRINALVIALIFSTPLFILGPIELAGHLPHFAAVVLLLFFGNGGHFLPFKTKKDLQEAPV